MALTKEEKSSIINEFKLDENDTGSIEVQVALLTKRINKSITINRIRTRRTNTPES